MGGAEPRHQPDWPERLRRSHVGHEACHVVDIMPTILAATGAAYPSELGGHALQLLQGESLLDALTGKDWVRQQPIFFEHEGNCAIRAGEFKLVRKHGQGWELYDMSVDRTELHDFAGKNAPLERDLLRQYRAWAEASGVLDRDVVLPRLLEAWKMESAEG